MLHVVTAIGGLHHVPRPVQADRGAEAGQGASEGRGGPAHAARGVPHRVHRGQGGGEAPGGQSAGTGVQTGAGIHQPTEGRGGWMTGATTSGGYFMVLRDFNFVWGV